MCTMRRADNWFARLPQMPVETCQMSVINRGMSAGEACDWCGYSFKVPWPRCNGKISRQSLHANGEPFFKAQAQKIRISTQLRGSQGTQPPTSPCIETSHGGTRLIPQMENTSRESLQLSGRMNQKNVPNLCYGAVSKFNKHQINTIYFCSPILLDMKHLVYHLFVLNQVVPTHPGHQRTAKSKSFLFHSIQVVPHVGPALAANLTLPETEACCPV